MEFKDTVQSNRLTLQRTIPNKELAETIFALVDKNRDYLKKWLDWVMPTKEPKDTLKYLTEKEEEYKNKTKIEYGMYYNEIYMGNISVFDINSEHKNGEIGYWIGEEFSNKGFVTEAVKILEQEAFKNWGLNRIQIQCDSENEASSKVALKNKYLFEGIRREEKFSPYFNGFRDTKVFSKLKSEFKEEK